MDDRLGNGGGGAAIGSPVEEGRTGSASTAVKSKAGGIIFGFLFGGMWVVAIIASLSVPIMADRTWRLS